jgi:hypothetical protein
MEPLSSLPSTLTGRLLSMKNPDGGWPYYEGKTSRLEPTCWALLALSAVGAQAPLDVLRGWPRRDGWFVDRSSDAVNVAFNGLAGVTLRALGAMDGELTALRQALVGMKGQRLPQVPAFRQDNSIQAWPWVDGTFSWTEPTAWALISLKKIGRDRLADARVQEAERMMLDRVCVTGGWNYGNSNALGADLEAYVPTTAMGLLALGDRRDHPAVRKSVQYLQAHRLSERSAMGLGFTKIALSIHDQHADDVDAALEAVASHTAFLSNVHLMAIALYSSAGRSRRYEAFRV